MITRRQFASGSAAAGMGSLVGMPPGAAVAERPPETMRIRLVQTPCLCKAPQYVAVDGGVGSVVGDERKVRQVLLNLLSNATFTFTLPERTWPVS